MISTEATLAETIDLEQYLLALEERGMDVSCAREFLGTIISSAYPQQPE